MSTPAIPEPTLDETQSSRSEPLETAAPQEVPARRAAVRLSRAARASELGLGLLARLSNASFGLLFTSWLMLVGVFAALYFLASFSGPVLLEHGAAILPDGHGLRTSIYFSFVTATSLGFGDVSPVGSGRIMSSIEAVLALMLFGVLVSKMVGRRQDELLEQIHATTFEMRLARVRTNLHLVLSDLVALRTECMQGREAAARVLPRVEGAALILHGELRAVHDLLFRPQHEPPEDVLQPLLAAMDGALGAMADLLNCQDQTRGSAGLTATALSLASLSRDVCAECVPRDHGQLLKGWMDRIQQHAATLEAGARAGAAST